MSEVLRFERILKDAGIEVGLMPVPRSLSTSCGTCAKTREEDYDKIMVLVEEKNIEYDDIYKE